jgi:hypothetical protein
MANTSPQAIAEPFPIPDPSASGSIRSERWVRAFNAQATQATYRAAVKFARFRSRLIDMAGKKVDRAYVQELVHNAFGDTWVGDPPWNPESCSLLDHVRGLIRHRSWKDAQWLRRHPHVPLSECDERAAIRAKSSHRIEALPQPSPIMLAEITAEVVGLLRRLAHGDDAVTRILDAWQDGHVDRAPVIVATGLSPSAYKAARSRIIYLIQNLPQSVRDRAIDILRSVQ